MPTHSDRKVAQQITSTNNNKIITLTNVTFVANIDKEHYNKILYLVIIKIL